VLLRGIPRAENAAIVGLRYLPGAREPVIDIRQVKNRQALPDTFRPSRRLVRDALEQRRQSVMYIWQKARPARTTRSWSAATGHLHSLSEEKHDTDPGGVVESQSQMPGTAREELGIYLSERCPPPRWERPSAMTSSAAI